VAMPGSVHAARWIRQLDGQGYEIHLFPSVSSSSLHPLLHGRVIFHCEVSSKDSGPRAKGLPVGHPMLAGAANLVSNKLLPDRPVERLTALLKKLRPDVVHSMELQAAGYLTLEARRRLGGDFGTWMVSNWGSDIYLFGRLPEHRGRLNGILSQCDVYLCECRRDLGLAKGLGLGSQPSFVLPSGGGLPLRGLAPWRAVPPSRRRRILLKGYQGWAGRALCGLRAIELLADELRDFEVVIYLPNPEVELKARLIAEDTGLAIRILPESSHDTMLRLHGQARVSIGLSISDAASTSFLEALAMGSFPIQSHTACADEWVVDGDTALLVPPEEPQVIAQALRRAISDDALVDHAASRNQMVVEERLGDTMIAAQVTDLYRRVLNREEMGSPS
jgi:glycosyl transferase family 1